MPSTHGYNEVKLTWNEETREYYDTLHTTMLAPADPLTSEPYKILITNQNPKVWPKVKLGQKLNGEQSQQKLKSKAG